MKESKETPDEADRLIATVRKWLESVVIDLNLCPFAKAEYLQNKVRIRLSVADDIEELLLSLDYEVRHLQKNSRLETSLLIHPYVLQRFEDYNQFLELADALLASLQLEGEFQIASFHPDYQFADTQPDAAQNYSNRSPYPLLHILREASVERAIDSHPDIHTVPKRNIELLEQLGSENLKARLSDCFEADE